jgi:hypothetical protein
MLARKMLEQYGRFFIAEMSGTQEYTGREVTPWIAVGFREPSGTIRSHPCGDIPEGRKQIRLWCGEEPSVYATDALKALEYAEWKNEYDCGCRRGVFLCPMAERLWAATGVERYSPQYKRAFRKYERHFKDQFYAKPTPVVTA